MRANFILCKSTTKMMAPNAAVKRTPPTNPPTTPPPSASVCSTWVCRQESHPERNEICKNYAVLWVYLIWFTLLYEHSSNNVLSKMAI